MTVQCIENIHIRCTNLMCIQIALKWVLERKKGGKRNKNQKQNQKQKQKTNTKTKIKTKTKTKTKQ